MVDRAWHDNSGKSPGWRLSHVCVVDLMRGDKFFFVCNKWLSISEGEGLVRVVI